MVQIKTNTLEILWMHVKLSGDTNDEDEVPKYCLSTIDYKLFLPIYSSGEM